MSYFEDDIHHLIGSVIPPPLQHKLAKNKGSNQGGKQICLSEEAAPTPKKNVVAHEEESQWHQ